MPRLPYTPINVGNTTGQLLGENLTSVLYAKYFCKAKAFHNVFIFIIPEIHQREYRTCHSEGCTTLAYRGGLGVQPPVRNSEVLTKLSRIPSSVENTSVTTLPEYGFYSFAD
jgi:hypothetical protein